jgi:hypothetical protein
MNCTSGLRPTRILSAQFRNWYQSARSMNVEKITETDPATHRAHAQHCAGREIDVVSFRRRHCATATDQNPGQRAAGTTENRADTCAGGHSARTARCRRVKTIFNARRTRRCLLQGDARPQRLPATHAIRGMVPVGAHTARDVDKTIKAAREAMKEVARY